MKRSWNAPINSDYSRPKYIQYALMMLKYDFSPLVNILKLNLLKYGSRKKFIVILNLLLYRFGELWATSLVWKFRFLFAYVEIFLETLDDYSSSISPWSNKHLKITAAHSLSQFFYYQKQYLTVGLTWTSHPAAEGNPITENLYSLHSADGSKISRPIKFLQAQMA